MDQTCLETLGARPVPKQRRSQALLAATVTVSTSTEPGGPIVEGTGTTRARSSDRLPPLPGD